MWQIKPAQLALECTVIKLFLLSSVSVVYLAVRVIREKPGYFAQKMQKAMKGLGTDDQALVRIIVSRSECDMVQIKHSFEQQFQGRLADWIRVGSIMMSIVTLT